MPAPASQSVRNILVVDDDTEGRALTLRWLKAAGYECAEAGAIAPAWEHLANHPVDLMVLDIRMPGGSGLDLLERLRKQGSKIPVIILSGLAEHPEVNRAGRIGADVYLTKPIDREAFLVQVGLLLAKRPEES